MAVYLGSHNVDMLGGQTSGGGGTPTLETITKSYTPSESQQTETITASSGYDGIEEVDVTVGAISSSYVGSGITRRSSTDLSASGATVTAPAGYYSSSASKSVSSGSATPAASISGSSASVSASNNTLTLSKTVSNTPQVSAGYISSGTAGNSSVSLSASVNTRSSSDLTASNLTVTAPAGYYGSAASKTLTDSNLTAGNIKKNVTIFGTTGTYEGSGGGSGMNISTATKTLTSAASSISFTGLSGEPTSFVVTSSTTQTTGGTKVVAVVYDGSTLNGIDITTQAANDTGFSKTYSSGTLTITATTASFQANEYKLVYSYGGSSENIGTANVQVGSGATSITFTGLSDEPSYFSCIFKSTFSTSSGYQRVMEVVYDGTSTYGHALDSSANALTSWSYTYNNGTLVISSTGTNNGGYFHQPGYYQLTYGIGGEAPAITVESLSVTENGTYTAPSGKAYSPVVVNVSGGTGTSKNAQTVQQGNTRVANTSYTKACGDLTVSKAGTYDVYWTCYRTSTSGTWGTQLYKNGSATGSEQSTFSSYYQTTHLSEVSLAKNDVLSVYAKTRGNNYYAYVGQLTIIEA